MGKSTILSVLTNAKPKIGNYHFTTLTPNLGILRHRGQDIVIADIPGLVEGAAEGIGLGHDFLRHVERTRLLLHVVDISGSEYRDPVEDFRQINHELAHYGNLSLLPQIVVCNKADLLSPDTNQIERMREEAGDHHWPLYVVSAATHQGFDQLMDAVAELLPTLPPIRHFSEETEADAEDRLTDDFSISVDAEGIYEVSGPAMQRLVDSVNFDDYESLNWFHRTLRRIGVIEALRKEGAGEGSTVRIGDMEFDFID